MLEKMSSGERMLGVITKSKIDRVPVLAMGSAYEAYLCKKTLEEYYNNPKLVYECQKWVHSMLQDDGGVGYNIPGGYNLDFGGELKYSRNPCVQPIAKKLIMNDIKEVNHLKVPDLKKAPLTKLSMEFDRICMENGEGVGVTAGSPMEVANDLIGINNLVKWTLKEPEAIHKVLRVSTDYLLETIKLRINEFGAENCGAFLPLPLESHHIISPKMFKEISLPYIKEIFTYLIDVGVKKWTIHLCGNHINNIETILEELPIVPRTVFSIGGEMELEDVSKIIGEEHILAGNLSTSIINVGTPQEVYDETTRLLKKVMNREGGYIMCPSCAIPPKTSAVNIHAMIKAVKDNGKY